MQDALGTLLADRTAVIIAHRLSTVEIADRVLVVDDGRIVADGPPADVLPTRPSRVSGRSDELVVLAGAAQDAAELESLEVGSADERFGALEFAATAARGVRAAMLGVDVAHRVEVGLFELQRALDRVAQEEAPLVPDDTTRQ